MTLELTKILLSHPWAPICAFLALFSFSVKWAFFVPSKRLKQLYSIETSRNERLPNNLSLLELTKKVMVRKPKIFYIFSKKRTFLAKNEKSAKDGQIGA